MGRPELGRKCTCAGCNAHFYDLNRSPAICPKCGAEQPPELPRPVRPPMPVRTRRFIERPQPSPAAEDERETLVTPDEDEEEAVEPKDDDDEEVDVEVETEIGR